MPRKNEDGPSAGQKLGQFLRSHGLTYRQFAERLCPPVSRSLIWSWCVDRLRPKPIYRPQIETLTEGEITEPAWASETETKRKQWIERHAPQDPPATGRS